MVGLTRANVKGEFRASLVCSRHEALEDRDIVDEPQAESCEVICSVFGSREYHELQIRVAPQSPHHISGGNPAFAYTTEGFDALTSWAMLEIGSYRELYRRWFRKTQSLPYET
jgi:hypothetical protein